MKPSSTNGYSNGGLTMPLLTTIELLVSGEVGSRTGGEWVSSWPPGGYNRIILVKLLSTAVLAPSADRGDVLGSLFECNQGIGDDAQVATAGAVAVGTGSQVCARREGQRSWAASGG